MKKVLILMLLSGVSLQAKEATYTSSTIANSCKKSGLTKQECKEHAKKPKEVIFTFKDLIKEVQDWNAETFKQLLNKAIRLGTKK